MKKFISLLLFSLLLAGVQGGVAQAQDTTANNQAALQHDWPAWLQDIQDTRLKYNFGQGADNTAGLKNGLLSLFRKGNILAGLYLETPPGESTLDSKWTRLNQKNHKLYGIKAGYTMLLYDTGKGVVQGVNQWVKKTSPKDILWLAVVVALLLIITGLDCSASGKIVVFANYTDLTMSLMAFILPFLISILYMLASQDNGDQSRVSGIILLVSLSLMTILSIITCFIFNLRSGRGVLGCFLGPLTKVLITLSFFLMVFRIFTMFDEAKGKKTASARLSATILAIFWAILIVKFIKWLTRITVVYKGWEPLGDWIVGRTAVRP
jgi:hypothetical protein